MTKNRIYAWRGDARFQPAASDDAVFISVEISGGDPNAAAVQPAISFDAVQSCAL